MYPSQAVVTHDPFFAVISSLKVDLFAIEAVKLLLVLLFTFRAKILRVILIRLIVFCVLVFSADLIAADIDVALFYFFGRRLTDL